MLVCVHVCVDDHSRVVLSLQDNTPGSDYINASFIDVRLPSVSCDLSCDMSCDY